MKINHLNAKELTVNELSRVSGGDTCGAAKRKTVKTLFDWIRKLLR